MTVRNPAIAHDPVQNASNMLEQLLDAPPATLFQNPSEVAEGPKSPMSRPSRAGST
jgi:hypothetical protein